MYDHKPPSSAAKRSLNQPPLLGATDGRKSSAVHIQLPTHRNHFVPLKLKSDYIFLYATLKMAGL